MPRGQKWLVGTAVLATLVLAALLVYIGFALGRVHAVPSSTDFWRAMGAPIATFAAALATIFVGLVAFFGAIFSSYRLDKHNEATRNQSGRTDELGRCWERFTWLVDRVSGGNGSGQGGASTIVFMPVDVVLEVIEHIEADAIRLDDASLRKAVRSYLQAVGNEF